MGWKIVASEPTSLRSIEATDTTSWFGFKDDVVVRLSPTQTGSRIDVRSVSRVARATSAPMPVGSVPIDSIEVRRFNADSRCGEDTIRYHASSSWR